MFFRGHASFRNWSLFLCTVGLTILTAVPVPAHAGSKPTSEKASSQTPAAAQALDVSVVKQMLDSGKPSEENHLKILGQLDGDWYYTAAVWAVPGAEPQRAMGKVTNRLVLESRFLSSAVYGNIRIGGHQLLFNSQGYLGYDNAKKSFTSVWLDNITTGMMTGEGKYDKKDNAIKETGQFTNPLTGRVEKFRSELQFTDAENYKRTVFVSGKSGKETKLMEFDFSKKIP